MIVYLAGSRAHESPRHTLFVSPAADLAGQEMPSEWVTDLNEPKTIPIEFQFGRAEVPSNMGDYLVKRGYARKTKIIFPLEA